MDVDVDDLNVGDPKAILLVSLHHKDKGDPFVFLVMGRRSFTLRVGR